MDALRAAERALERVVSMVAENEERGEDATRPRTETPRAKLQERLEALERLNAGPAVRRRTRRAGTAPRSREPRVAALRRCESGERSWSFGCRPRS
mmetsp:Transcript_13217/g.46310  ORF Transcript_13217/g.46310 Transcript_13217/m.46310 type:complete len:96 (-) Transcript_13217:331-618(-)